MKKIKTCLTAVRSIAIAITMLVAGTTIATAHEAKGPHGGQMIDASNGYHAELLNKDGKVSVYLLDDKGKPMSNKGITGSIILQFADKTSATVTLTPSGEDGFSVTNDKASACTSSVVTFKVNGKTATAKFKAEKKETAMYQCPMKCEGEKTYDKQGKCPKCGMALTEVKKKVEEYKHKEGDKHHH